MAFDLKKCTDWIDNHKQEAIKLLSDAVAIPCVSAWAQTHRHYNVQMAEFVRDQFKALNATHVELRPLLSKQQLHDGSEVDLPPIVLAQVGDDRAKKTVLIYGHLDVQPALKSDGWDTDPWVLTEKNGNMFGRGSTDDKGPVLGWLVAIKSYRETGQDIPVNLKFILEGMEESGSLGLEELLLDMRDKKDKFLQGIDYCVISDSYWLGTKKPCLSYGLRGNCCFGMKIQCAAKDQHSGAAGGLINEAMSDMAWLLGQLVDVNGKILVDGIYDQVAPITQEEEDTYKDIDFSVQDRKKEIGATHFWNEDSKARVLQATWRNPSLSVHGIEGAFAEPGFKTVIPGSVVGKFSVRTVPNMDNKVVEKLVIEYLNKLWKQRGSRNTFEPYLIDSGDWYCCETSSGVFPAARRAIKKVFNVDVDLVREGGSIPITLTIQKCTGKAVCLLPMGCSDDGAHSQNEKLGVLNYIQGAKVFAAFFNEAAQETSQ